jgi:hypothetical protein
VHDIDVTASVIDAGTGAVLVPEMSIRAELAALSGDQMKAARAKGQAQDSTITNHVTRTVQGWLGIGPDNRSEFFRRGGVTPHAQEFSPRILALRPSAPDNQLAAGGAPMLGRLHDDVAQHRYLLHYPLTSVARALCHSPDEQLPPRALRVPEGLIW